MYLVQDSVHPGILYMWEHMRTFAIYFLQYRPGQHTEALINKAQTAAFKFAEYAEKHLQGKFMTTLVHRLFHHIPSQVRRGLPGAFVREDWGEHCVRKCKRLITSHATKMAARAATKICLTQMKLRSVKARHPDVDAPLGGLTADKPVRAMADKGDMAGCMLSHLKPADTGEDRDEVSSSVYPVFNMQLCDAVLVCLPNRIPDSLLHQ